MLSAESSKPVSYGALLRQELCARNAAYAHARQVPHVTSYGEMPVIVYEPFSGGLRHGNFLDASYRAVLRQPEWKRRLEKVHGQAARCLPRNERRWKELDSSMSSDALLMNVFCHPRTPSRSLRSMLGLGTAELPEFGFKARVPLRGGRTDRTEIDMKLGGFLVESKLTEADFQVGKPQVVESYRDLEDAFDREALPRLGGRYVSYQLIRNVLAAHALELDFCVLLDARRPDLLESWYSVMKCVRIAELKTRCKVLSWQELSETLPPGLQHYLDVKYGIVPPGRNSSDLGSEH